MSYYEFEYEAPIERLPIGNGQKILYYQVVILPDDLCRLLPFDIYPKLRIIGEIGDHPVRGAWNLSLMAVSILFYRKPSFSELNCKVGIYDRDTIQY